MFLVEVTRVILLSSVFFNHPSEVHSTFLTIQNNKYENLVIAISSDIKEDKNIITKIKEIVTEASPFLYKATRKRAYFGHVKILLPDNWSHDTATLAITETFEEADIRIDKPNPQYGDNPYTYQPQGCGDPGMYIHFTDTYILDTDGMGVFNYGPAGKVLVHEFSHLRYGVFDEYGLGTTEYPYFYLKGSDIRPTGCVDAVRGRMTGNCQPDAKTSLPSGIDCVFVTHRDQNTAKGSIMYDSSIKSVTTYCESNTNDADLRHNPDAPNQQNKMCNKRGTWDIVKEHLDFKGANLPVNKAEAEMKPTFSLLYAGKPRTISGDEICGRPVVLVLDVSWSMEGDRIFRQTQTVDKLIRDILPIGTKVGVVKFSEFASVVAPLTTLSTLDDRDRVSSQLPTIPETKTAIGKGLLKAKEMLKEAGETKEGRIILITDGEENVRPFVSDIEDRILSTDIRVHTVAYSKGADMSLRGLSQKTGGQYAFYSENSQSTVLDGAIESLMKDLSICNHRVRIEILRTAEALIPKRDVAGQVLVDASLGNDTLFVFTLPLNNTVSVTLLSPSGSLYSSSSHEYTKDTRLNIVRFNFQKAESGVWHYTLTGSDPGMVSVVVKSLPADLRDPYRIVSWISSSGVNLNVTQPKATVVYVSVRKGYSPVLDAEVAVTVETPSGKSVSLKPEDKGVLPDNLANDGVYSVYFTQYSGNNRYSLDVEVRSIAGKTRYLVQGKPTYGGAMTRYHNADVVLAVAGNFTRTSSPVGLDVSGFKPHKDIFPPSRVTDLHVVHVSNGIVTLTWTAPGDDLSTGTALRYEIRMAQSTQQLRDSWNSCLKVNPRNIRSGSLTPHHSGTKETITVLAPATWATAAFALKTVDDSSHISEISNCAVVTF